MNKFRTIIYTVIITVFLMSAVFGYLYKTKIDEIEPITAAEMQTTGGPDSTSISTADYRSNITSDINNDRSNMLTRTVSNVSPAVVGINVTEIQQVRVRSPFSFDPFFEQFFGNRVYNQEIKGLGSGVLISSDGYILTNDHVAGNAVEAVVTLTDGSRYDAKIIGTDPASDICLLKINAQNLPYVQFGNSKDILIGEWVIALGNPFGLFSINDKPTVTVGVISATGMNLGNVRGRYYFDMIQTDASINGGNSGGPLVNGIGELIGINTLIYTASGSTGSVGVGFAIPINKVKKIVEELKTEGKVDRNFWTGLRIQRITQSIAKYYNLTDTKGVIITQVENGSPAHSAGLEVGDIIRKVDNYRIQDDNTMVDLLNNYQTNDVIALEIQREENTLIKNLKLERRK